MSSSPVSRTTREPKMASNTSSRVTSRTTICSETEIEMHRIIYNWDINSFDRICTPESDEFEPISSSPFRAGQEINRDSEWDLILSAEGGYLQIWLYLKKLFNELTKDISVNLTVLILKADGSTLLRRRCDKNQTFTAEDNGWGMGYIITIETLWDEKDIYLVDNKLRLQIQLDILGDLVSRFKTPGTGALLLTRPPIGKRKRTTDDYEAADNEDPGCALLKRDMKKLFKSQHDADFTIECGQKSFPVHKVILSARSKVFAAMFKHDTVETRSNIVKINDIPASTVEKLMEYVYTGCVKLPVDLEETMHLIQASDKYQLSDLKNRCLRSLCTQITQENVGKIAIHAYLHNAELVIQEEIRHYCRSNWDSLLKKKSFKDCLISTPRAFFDDIKGLSDSD